MTIREGQRDPTDLAPGRGDATRRLTRLYRLADEMDRLSPALARQAFDLPSVLAEVLRALRDLVQFRGGSVCVVEGDSVRILAADPQPSEDVLALRIPVGSGLAGRIVTSGQAAWSSDLDRDDRVDTRARHLGSNAGMRSYLGVPLLSLGKVVGLLQIDSAKSDAFTTDDLHLLRYLASEVARALDSTRRYEEVAELERMKAEFVSSVSHELRTPLTIVQGFISLLAREQLDESTKRDVVERAERAVKRLNELVERLLTFTRLEAGSLRVDAVASNIRGALEEAVSHSIDPTRVVIDCPVDLELQVDALVLEQTVGVVVDNALKYGGAARISVVGAAIAIEDEGPGLSAEIAALASEPFFRGTHEVPGLGIGLSLARTLMDLGGGQLRIEQPPAGGTRVVLDFTPLDP